MANLTLQGANRCAFFANRNKVAKYYAPIKIIEMALATGQHYTLAQLRELAGTTCARKSIHILRENGMPIKDRVIPHSKGHKEYWIEKEVKQ